MARSRLLHTLRRMARAALREHASGRAAPPFAALARRTFLRRAAALALAGTASGWAPPALASPKRRTVAVVGAGLAGLTAAYLLRKAGVRATVYEGSPRAGGRCWTEYRAFADGQLAERGGELIDTPHQEIRALALEFNLVLDDLLEAEPAGSQSLAFFDGAPYVVNDVDRDFRGIAPRLAADSASLGDDLPTYRRHTPAQRRLDGMSAAQWIESRVPGGRQPRFGRLLVNAYTEELGGDPEEVSAVTVVSLLAGSPRDRFSPYEESDQRYHIRGGNDQLVARLAHEVDGQIEPHTRLVAIARMADGRYRLTLLRDGAERVTAADCVILAIPFTLLRGVDTTRAGFRPRKVQAIGALGMGRNTKLQLQFTERFWQRAGGNGEVRLEGAFQTTWDVTRAQAGRAGILNFFSGGAAAEEAALGYPEERARMALAELERALPGATARWNGRVIRNAWDRNPWSLGSYALLRPGQYTAFHGIEGEREGNVFFAGEHTSIDSQGYLNGAIETGKRAAHEVLAALRAPRAAPALGAA